MTAKKMPQKAAAKNPTPFRTNSTTRYDIMHGEDVVGIVKEHEGGHWSFDSWKPLPRPLDGQKAIARYTGFPNEGEAVSAALRFFARRLEGVALSDLSLAPHDESLVRERARNDEAIQASIEHAQALLEALKKPKKPAARRA
jgi:hypothetical protein